MAKTTYFMAITPDFETNVLGTNFLRTTVRRWFYYIVERLFLSRYFEQTFDFFYEFRYNEGSLYWNCYNLPRLE